MENNHTLCILIKIIIYYWPPLSEPHSVQLWFVSLQPQVGETCTNPQLFETIPAVVLFSTHIVNSSPLSSTGIVIELKTPSQL